MKIGDKVQTLTHPREAVTGSPPQQPGATGTVCGIGLDDVNLLRVRHDDGSEPWYYACDLIRIREGAATAGKDPLEQRLATLERRHGALREAMTSELHGLDQRLAALEPAEQLTGEPVANPAALAQAWERLTQAQRDELQRWMMAETPGYLPPYAHRLAAESALVAVPGLIAEIVRLRARRDKPPVSVLQAYEGLHRVARSVAATGGTDLDSLHSLHDALQTLAELGVNPGEPCPVRDPDEPAPAPGAAKTIEQLRLRVEELTEQRAQLLAAVAHVARQAHGIEDPDATAAVSAAKTGHAAVIHLAAITARLRAIVPWDADEHSAEELLDAIEQPAKLALLLTETTTPTQLVRVATGIRALTAADHASPAALVAEMLEHLAEDGS